MTPDDAPTRTEAEDAILRTLHDYSAAVDALVAELHAAAAVFSEFRVLTRATRPPRTRRRHGPRLWGEREVARRMAAVRTARR